MSINITHVRLSQGNSEHEHITDLKWYRDNESGSMTVAELVEWIDVKKGQALVDPRGIVPRPAVPVVVVKPSGKTPYLRTRADGEWTDNLLSLPRF